MNLLNHRDRREGAVVDDFLKDAKRKIKKEIIDDHVNVPLIPELSYLDPVKRSILGKRKPGSVQLLGDEDEDLPWKTVFSHLGKR